jgi:hypothetical protein
MALRLLDIDDIPIPKIHARKMAARQKKSRRP